MERFKGDHMQPPDPPEYIECSACHGEGKIYYSCCGDEVYSDDTLCPTCREHIDGVEPEICDVCEGTGYVDKPEIINPKLIILQDMTKKDK